MPFLNMGRIGRRKNVSRLEAMIDDLSMERSVVKGADKVYSRGKQGFVESHFTNRLKLFLDAQQESHFISSCF